MFKIFFNPVLYAFCKNSVYGKLIMSEKLRFVRVDGAYQKVIHLFWKFWINDGLPYGWNDSEMELINVYTSSPK